MQYFLYLFSILWILLGLFFIFFPKKGKKLISVVIAMPRGLLGIIILVIGALFWYSAPIVAVPLFIKIIAIIVLIKGLSFLFIPRSLVKKSCDRFLGWSTGIYIVCGFVAIAIAIYILQIII